jgi:hypothetical protein
MTGSAGRTGSADPAQLARRLGRDEWLARRAAHERRVDGWLDEYLGRRQIGGRHPVQDFLFTYYSFRPARLRRWHPGVGITLLDASPAELGPGYVTTAGGAALDSAAIVARRAESIGWIRAVLTRTAARPAQLGCFGMHEWAMVYRQSPQDIRHAAWPLRFSPQRTAEIVEQQRIRCTHFDAFRFFTLPARPLNLIQPTRAAQPDHEQPGCLHANMDLYKWAYKLVPLVESELVADCFALAREIRTLDMRASPYDLAALGYPPVRVETPEGRAEYASAQRGFAERAAPLRTRLIEAIDRASRAGAATGR